MAQQETQFKIGDLVNVQLLRGGEKAIARILNINNNNNKCTVYVYGRGKFDNIGMENISECDEELLPEIYLKEPNSHKKIDETNAIVNGVVLKCDDDAFVSVNSSPVIDDPKVEVHGCMNEDEMDYSEDDEHIVAHQVQHGNPIEGAVETESISISSESAKTTDASKPQTHGDRIVELERKNLLIAERDFMKHCLQLHDYLKIEYGSLDNCVKLMESLSKLQLSRLVLLRNPNSVDQIRKLRSYEGGRKQYNFCIEEELKYKKDIKIIRQYAVTIYNKFRRMFRFDGTKEFWEDFTKYVQEFKEKTKNLSKHHRVLLTEDEYQNLLIKRSNEVCEEHEANAMPDTLQNEGEIIELE